MTESDILSHIGIVPQKSELFAGTIKSNILFGNDGATDDEIKEALDCAVIIDKNAVCRITVPLCHRRHLQLVEIEIIVLENQHGIFAIDPKRNGGIVFAYDKLSKNNCIPGEYEVAGAFLDRFHSGSARRDFYLDVKYDCKVVADTPERKQVVVSGKGKGGIFINVLVEKRYTLDKNSAVLRTDYTITNLQENVVDLESGYWLFNGFLFPAGGVRLVPGIYGIEKIDPAIKEFYHRELSGSWFGGGSKEWGTAYVFPYELFGEV
jgi:hypothetical protein